MKDSKILLYAIYTLIFGLVANSAFMIYLSIFLVVALLLRDLYHFYLKHQKDPPKL